ncbi:putative membrane protein [Yersinia pestis biovar Microtus str. 91001]|nr:hypothetical [Yersinia pestis KIM10+]AAS62867.1 putative membrane protein [Yersinia pestis biovar Microtus str. 91001]CAH22015.1 putative membrane protein [Yersinia pseudotuberculosis IP 32953]
MKYDRYCHNQRNLTMQWLADYWWIILILLVGMILNGIKELRRLDHKRFLDNKPELPPHRDNNAQWDDEDDWPDQNKKK